MLNCSIRSGVLNLNIASDRADSSLRSLEIQVAGGDKLNQDLAAFLLQSAAELCSAGCPNNPPRDGLMQGLVGGMNHLGQTFWLDVDRAPLQ